MDKLTRLVVSLIEMRVKERIAIDSFEKQSTIEVEALNAKIQIFKKTIEGVKKTKASEYAKNAIIEPVRIKWLRVEEKHYKELRVKSSNLKKTQALVNKRERMVAKEIVEKKTLVEGCIEQGRTAEGERLQEEMIEAINLLQSTKQED